MRELRHHERKLLKKVDFLQWKSEHSHRECRRFGGITCEIETSLSDSTCWSVR